MSKAPEPHADPKPAENPGGVDALAEPPEDFPLATPEPPIPAHLTGEGAEPAAAADESNGTTGEPPD